MKYFYSIISSLAMVFMLMGLTPQPVFAQEGCDQLQDKFNQYGGQYANVADGLPKFCTATSLIQFIMNLIFALIGGITMVMFIIGGYQYIFAAGNQEMASKGKQTVTWAAIGLAVILMAAAIINIVINMVVNNKLF